MAKRVNIMLNQKDILADLFTIQFIVNSEFDGFMKYKCSLCKRKILFMEVFQRKKQVGPTYSIKKKCFFYCYRVYFEDDSVVFFLMALLSILMRKFYRIEGNLDEDERTNILKEENVRICSEEKIMNQMKKLTKITFLTSTGFRNSLLFIK